MLMNEYIVIFCLIVVIYLLVYLQYALGIKKASVRTALTLPHWLCRCLFALNTDRYGRDNQQPVAFKQSARRCLLALLAV